MNVLDNFLSPVMETLGAFAPQFVGALFVLLVGWIVAKLVSRGIRRLVALTGVSERMGRGADSDQLAVEDIVARFAYYLILFFVLVFVLNSLGYASVLDPVKAMYQALLGAVPNLIGALFIGGIGYMVAKIVASIAEMAGEGLERLMARGGITGVNVSKLVHVVVFVLVFAPALLAAFEKLDIDVISQPATQMLAAVLAAVPRILAAGVILLVAVVGGRIVGSLTTQLLAGSGADALPERLGAEAVFRTTSLSAVTGKLVFFFILLTASVTAAERLGFALLSSALGQVLTFAGSVLVGLVIFAVGHWLASLAYRALQETGSQLAPVVRFGILGLVLAMGLKAMGLADDIVNLAFGLTLGSLAVAFALAFGLGGREAAGAELSAWLERRRLGS